MRRSVRCSVTGSCWVSCHYCRSRGVVWVWTRGLPSALLPTRNLQEDIKTELLCIILTIVCTYSGEYDSSSTSCFSSCLIRECTSPIMGPPIHSIFNEFLCMYSPLLLLWICKYSSMLLRRSSSGQKL